MSEQETSPNEQQPLLTQHAMLVLWGAFAQQIGLVKMLEQIDLRQKKRDARAQTKIMEFLLAILAGLPHLQDLSCSAHPLDQDQAVAEAWDQPGWADYSGVSRTLQSLNDEEANDIIDAVTAVSQPFIDQECERALASAGRLVYDADLTGRPVSNTSTTYPDTAFGYMGDTVSLGYQAALVSLHSPTYGRLWLADQLHPGDTVSVTQVQALMLAAEESTGYRPRRRTELVAARLAEAEAALAPLKSHTRQATRKNGTHRTKRMTPSSIWRIGHVRDRASNQSTRAAGENRLLTANCLEPGTRRRCTKSVCPCAEGSRYGERRLFRCEQKLVEAKAEVNRLRLHHQQLLDENESNPHPIRASFESTAVLPARRTSLGLSRWATIWIPRLAALVYEMA